MKRIFFLFFIFILFKANGQNEFAAKAFYSEFKKVYEDSRNGFYLSKGIKRTSEFEDLADEYQVTILLPLADSGKVVFPFSGIPYVIYYFEPDKVRLKVDQRGAYLRDAVLTALDLPLYARSETVLIKDRPLTNTWYFLDPNETRQALALFRLYIYFKNGKYFLSFEIRGT